VLNSALSVDSSEKSWDILWAEGEHQESFLRLGSNSFSISSDENDIYMVELLEPFPVMSLNTRGEKQFIVPPVHLPSVQRNSRPPSA